MVGEQGQELVLVQGLEQPQELEPVLEPEQALVREALVPAQALVRGQALLLGQAPGARLRHRSQRLQWRASKQRRASIRLRCFSRLRRRHCASFR